VAIADTVEMAAAAEAEAREQATLVWVLALIPVDLVGTVVTAGLALIRVRLAVAVLLAVKSFGSISMFMHVSLSFCSISLESGHLSSLY
jgi:hypothetical protein